MNPFDESVEAIFAQVQVDVELKPTIDEHFHIFLHAVNPKAEIIHFEPYFKSSTTKDDLNRIVDFWLPLGMTYVNKFVLKDGISLDKSLDLPFSVEEFFTAPGINYHEKYVEIDATPEFKSLK